MAPILFMALFMAFYICSNKLYTFTAGCAA